MTLHDGSCDSWSAVCGESVTVNRAVSRVASRAINVN